MKRGGPLKRGKPLQRKAPLKARKTSLKRTAMKRKPRPKRPPEGPLTPLDYKREVWRRAGGFCAATGLKTPLYAGEAHHPLPKRELRKRKLYDEVWNPDNGIWLCQAVHEAHENGSRRIPRVFLPATVWTFCDRLGPWAAAIVERSHPDHA